MSLLRCPRCRLFYAKIRQKTWNRLWFPVFFRHSTLLGMVRGSVRVPYTYFIICAHAKRERFFLHARHPLLSHVPPLAHPRWSLARWEPSLEKMWLAFSNVATALLSPRVVMDLSAYSMSSHNHVANRRQIHGAKENGCKKNSVTYPYLSFYA